MICLQGVNRRNEYEQQAKTQKRKSLEKRSLWRPRVATLFVSMATTSAICPAVTGTWFYYYNFSEQLYLGYQDATHFQKCGSNVILSTSNLVLVEATPY